MSLDAMIAQIYLRIETCRLFETAFNLTFDRMTNLYLVNDSLSTLLMSQNTCVTFELGAFGHPQPKVYTAHSLMQALT